MPRYVDLTPPILAHAAPAWAPGAIGERTHYTRAHYATAADLARAASAPPAWWSRNPHTLGWEKYSRAPFSASFYGSHPFRPGDTGAKPTLDEMRRLLTEGWQEGAERAADAAARLAGAVAHTPRVIRRGIAGARPLVALAVSGDPRHMLSRAPMPRGARTVSLTLPCGAPANVTAPVLAAGAITAAAVADRLEAAHYRVELITVDRAHRGGSSGACAFAAEIGVGLKAPSEAVDAATIAVVAGHPWLARYAMFLAFCQDEASAHAPNGIGGDSQGANVLAFRPRSASDPDAPIMLPEAAEYARALRGAGISDAWSNKALARCLALAVESLNAQGEGDPLAPRLDPVAWQDVA